MNHIESKLSTFTANPEANPSGTGSGSEADPMIEMLLEQVSHVQYDIGCTYNAAGVLPYNVFQMPFCLQNCVLGMPELQHTGLGMPELQTTAVLMLC